MSSKTLKKRRSFVVLFVMLAILLMGINPDFLGDSAPIEPSPPVVLSDTTDGTELALDVLEQLEVKGRATKSGYSRDEFGSGWATIDGCDMRNTVLERSMSEIELGSDRCTVERGVLHDPYTAKMIDFMRGSTTSDAVQIDHVVALSDAWQKGAQGMEFIDRVIFANDPLNLIAVDGPINQQKGDSDAASWLPPNKDFRCRYVARQIAVKRDYNLWVTEAEKAAMKRVLNGCTDQTLPIIELDKKANN